MKWENRTMILLEAITKITIILKSGRSIGPRGEILEIVDKVIKDLDRVED